MRSIVFEGDTWEEYEKWRTKDPRVHKRLCQMIKEMKRDDPSKGIGKPERLKNKMSGYWSRRLTKKDRLVYKFDRESIYIFIIGGHYGDH